MGTESKQPRSVIIPVEQDIISFYGHELLAVRLQDGRIAAVLRYLCESLNLDARGQQQRIERKTALQIGLIWVRVDTAGGPQEMPALTLKVLPGWLFTIDENRVKPEAREDLVLFQAECVDVLAEHFAHKHGGDLPALAAPQSLSPADPRIAEIAEQLDTLTSVMLFMREHLQDQQAQLAANTEQISAVSVRLDEAVALLETLAARQNTAETTIARIDERTQRLTPAHARAIQEQVDRMVHETRRLPFPLTHYVIYGRLKRKFKAGSYREIPDERYEEILNFLIEELRRALNGEGPEQGSLF